MSDALKLKVACVIAERIKPNTCVGVGTGSTVSLAISEIAKRVKSENLNVRFVTTSHDSARQLAEAGLAVLDAGTVDEIDFGFDGVDYLTSSLNAIKGKGAAMLREKIMAAKCKCYVYICDHSKIVSTLNNCVMPIEIVPEALGLVSKRLIGLGAKNLNLRSGAGKFGGTVTELGNLILDCEFSVVNQSLEQNIKNIVGVVESGLFYNYAQEALVAHKDRVEQIKIS